MDAIVAVYSDWGIGADGTQPVVLKADRQHFVELTRGRTVIVGRKTLADFPGGRPLKGRRNIVLTRQSTVIDGAEIAHSPEQARSLCADDAMVLGFLGDLSGGERFGGGSFHYDLFLHAASLCAACIL